MDDLQLLRYSRHILLPEISSEGQEAITRSHALIIGAGGLGSPVAMFLAASGVGKITICDDDQVDLTNLQRQLAHTTHDIGRPKVISAQETMRAINPHIDIVGLQQRVDGATLTTLVHSADVVIDCSDNFPTRYSLNRICHQLSKPLVSGAATRFDGQVCVFDFRVEMTGCYQCLYPEQLESEETRCALMGVFSPLVGIIGSIQSAEALKILAGIGTGLHGRLLLLDALNMNMRSVKLHKDPACCVCAA